MRAQGTMAPLASESEASGTVSAGSNLSSVPRPSHLGHAPNGLLNENSRGSISSMVKPETGQAKRWEKMMRSGSAGAGAFFAGLAPLTPALSPWERESGRAR